MSLELIIRPEAEAEIAAAGDWYNRQRPGLGTEFVLAVGNTLAAIQRNHCNIRSCGRNSAALESLDSHSE